MRKWRPKDAAPATRIKRQTNKAARALSTNLACYGGCIILGSTPAVRLEVSAGVTVGMVTS
jgi:hypothetical protein